MLFVARLRRYTTPGHLVPLHCPPSYFIPSPAGAGRGDAQRTAPDGTADRDTAAVVGVILNHRPLLLPVCSCRGDVQGDRYRRWPSSSVPRWHCSLQGGSSFGSFLASGLAGPGVSTPFRWRPSRMAGSLGKDGLYPAFPAFSQAPQTARQTPQCLINFLRALPSDR